VNLDIKRRVIRYAVVVAWTVSLLETAALAQTICVSPTGHAPKLLWTPQQQCIWNRMRDEHHPLFQIIIANANGHRWVDLGRWEALAYQITGDQKYAQAAFANLDSALDHFTSDFDANNIREYGTELVILWDWLLPGLTGTQSNQMLAWMKMISEKTLKGQRFGDSDQITGAYFQLAAMDQVAGTR